LGAKEKDIIKLREAEKRGFQDIASRLGYPNRDAAARAYTRAKSGDAPESIVRPTPRRARLGDVIDLGPAPFAVPIAKAPEPKEGKSLTAVVIGDTQIPFHDKKCLSVVEGVLAQVNPDIFAHMGDLVDCVQISDYDRDPNRLVTLQEDIDTARRQLHRFSQLAKRARRVLLKGNHEDRLQRLIWRLPDTARELARLRSFREAMTWPRLLELDDIGWEWVEDSEQSRTEILPKLVSIHGHQLKGGTSVEGASARKAMQKYGRSVIVGHHHRACVITRRDHNGQAFGIETGCTCLLDGQPYGSDWNWQQAVTIIEWSGDRKVMHVQQVHVRDGRAIHQNKEYRAA
jgi:hypothetical protein